MSSFESMFGGNGISSKTLGSIEEDEFLSSSGNDYNDYDDYDESSEYPESSQ